MHSPPDSTPSSVSCGVTSHKQLMTSQFIQLVHRNYCQHRESQVHIDSNSIYLKLPLVSLPGVAYYEAHNYYKLRNRQLPHYL